MTFTILAYNINGGARARMEDLSAVLAQADADLVALTEADDPETVAALAERGRYHSVWARGTGDRHAAVLARRPITAWRNWAAPPLTQAAVEVRLAEPAPVTVYTLHLLPYLLLPYEIRRWQAVGRLLAIIRAGRPGPHLIVGDLNAIAPGDQVLQRRNPARMRRVMALQANVIFRFALPRLLRAGYVDCFRRLHPDDAGFTWQPHNRTTRYDYILADPRLAGALKRCEVVEAGPAGQRASDHLPVCAEFEWPPSPTRQSDADPA